MMGSKNVGVRSMFSKGSPEGPSPRPTTTQPQPPPPVSPIPPLTAAPDPSTSTILTAFHQGMVRSVDVAVSRPLIVTCGEDRFVRIFNFAERKCKLQKQFADDTLSVAIHPSGLYVAVGMADKLRLFFVMADDLLLIKEYHVPGCKQVSFSHGGRFFVAANQHATLVYETYTLTSHGVLKGHVSGLESVCWSPSDHRIATAGADGAIYEWHADKCTRDHSTENVLKIAHYTCIAYGSAASWLVASSVERGQGKVKLLAGGTCEFEMHIEGCHVTALALTHNDKVLLAATDTGCMRSYPWFGRSSPHSVLTSAAEWPHLFTEYRLHTSPITQMRLSPDHTVLLSCDTSGALGVTETQRLLSESPTLAMSAGTGDAQAPGGGGMGDGGEKGHGGNLSAPGIPSVSVSYGPEVYIITWDEFSDKSLAVEEARVQLEDEKIKGQYELMRTEKRWKERVATMEAEAAEVLASSVRKAEMYEAQMRRMEEENMRDVRCMEAAHMTAAEELESLYKLKLVRAEERITRIKQLLEDEKCRAEEGMERLSASHREAMRVREEELAALMRVKDATIQDMEDTTLSLQRLNLETERQQVEDMDREIEQIEAKSSAEIERQLAGKEDLRVQLHWMKSQFEQMSAQVLQSKNIAARWEAEAKAAVLVRDETLAQLTSCKEVLQQREAAIERKEASLSKLRLMNKDLELHKYVLEDRMSTLQCSIQPREDEVKHLRTQITLKEDELSRTLTEIRMLTLSKKDREEKLHGLRKELEGLTLRILDQETKIRDISHRISLLFETEVTPREREERLLSLYREHCLDEHKRALPDPGLDAVLREVCRQRSVAEKKTVLAQQQVALHRKDSARALHKSRSDNVFLLTENMQLRRENKILSNKVDMRGGGTGLEKARPATAPVLEASENRRDAGMGASGGSAAVPPLGAAAIALAQHISAADLAALLPSPAPNNAPTHTQGVGKGQSDVGAWAFENGTNTGRKSAPAPTSSWRGGGGFTSRSGRLVKGTSTTALARVVAEEQETVTHLLNKVRSASEVIEKQQKEIEQLRRECAERDEHESDVHVAGDAAGAVRSLPRSPRFRAAKSARIMQHSHEAQQATTGSALGSTTARPSPVSGEQRMMYKEWQPGGRLDVGHTSRQGLWKGLALAQPPSFNNVPRLVGTTSVASRQSASSMGMDNHSMTSQHYVASASVVEDAVVRERATSAVATSVSSGKEPGAGNERYVGTPRSGGTPRAEQRQSMYGSTSGRSSRLEGGTGTGTGTGTGSRMGSASASGSAPPSRAGSRSTYVVVKDEGPSSWTRTPSPRQTPPPELTP